MGLKESISILIHTKDHPLKTVRERERRGTAADHQFFTIEGPQQKRPQSFQKMIMSESFKQELPIFLAKDWQSEHYKTILEGQEVYLGVKDSCTRFYVKNGIVKTEVVSTLCCNHTEADTRTILNMIDA